MGRLSTQLVRSWIRFVYTPFLLGLSEAISIPRAVLRHGNGSSKRKVGAFFVFWVVSAGLTVPAIVGMFSDEATRDEVLPMLFLTSDAWRPQEDTTGNCCHGGCFHCNWARQQRHVEERLHAA